MNITPLPTVALPQKSARANAAAPSQLQTLGETKDQEPMPSGAARHDTRAPRLSQKFNMRFLVLQQEMQMENRKFTTLSTMMKTKHSTASAAISNIK